MSCQQVPTTPAFNPYPRSVQVGEFEVAIGGGIWVAIRVLIDGEGKLLAHPKADLALKPASEIAKGIDAGMLPSWLLTARVPMC